MTGGNCRLKWVEGEWSSSSSRDVAVQCPSDLAANPGVFNFCPGAYILTRFRFAPQSSFSIVLLRYPDYLSLWITKNIVPWLNGTLSIICLPTIYNPLISIEISFLNNYEQWWSLGNLLSINRSSWPLHTRSFRAPDSFLNQLVSPTLGGRIGKNIRAWLSLKLVSITMKNIDV